MHCTSEELQASTQQHVFQNPFNLSSKGFEARELLGLER